MRIYRLTVFEKVGRIVVYFSNRDNAIATYNTTYSKVAMEDRPEWKVEDIDVHERSTHL